MKYIDIFKPKYSNYIGLYIYNICIWFGKRFEDKLFTKKIDINTRLYGINLFNKSILIEIEGYKNNK